MPVLPYPPSHPLFLPLGNPAQGRSATTRRKEEESMSPSPRRPCRLEGTPTRSPVPLEGGTRQGDAGEAEGGSGRKTPGPGLPPSYQPAQGRERRGADRRRPRSRALTTEQYRGESSWP